MKLKKSIFISKGKENREICEAIILIRLKNNPKQPFN